MEKFNCSIGDAEVTVYCSNVQYNNDESCRGWELEDVKVFKGKKEIIVSSKTLDDLKDQVISQLKQEIRYGAY
jgi:hypothetical protein